jgi:addiction module HigA family antidote
MAIKMDSSLAVHVGSWLKTEVVEPSGLSVRTLARHFSVSRQALSRLLAGRTRLAADMALRFEKGFGINADTLLRMQLAYETAQARAREDEIHVERISPPTQDPFWRD